MGNNMKIDGFEFRNKTDYQAGLRDQAKIKKIKSEYDLTNPSDIRKVIQLINQNDYQFESELGRAFDDHLYELSSQASVGDHILSINQERLDQEAIVILQKKDRRRRLCAILFALIGVSSLGYAFHYYSQYEGNSSQVELLNSLKESTNQSLVYVPETIIDESGNSVQLVVLPEYQDLYALNKKLIGWVKIDDTVIDYPVMQTVNNEYYLEYGFDQNKDNNGSIFLDYRNDIINRNMNFILYGHNMQSGKMFGSLSNYRQESYYKNHSIIEFDTIYERGTYEIAFVFEGTVYTNQEIAFKYYEFLDAVSEQEFNSNIQAMKDLSFYDTGVEVTYGDELLTLSTCDSSDTKRFVVVAKRIS
ncbi:MAG: class B sortase [Eubacteriales bacterium]